MEHHSSKKLALRQNIAACVRTLLAQLPSLPREFRPYQVETLEAFARWLEDPQGSDRVYIEHATGLGKTEVFAAIVSACVGFRSLIVVPSKILIEQTARRVVQYTGGIIGHISSLGHIKDDDDQIIAIRGHDFSDIVITTDESLRVHGPHMAKHFAPHLIIRDECHGAYTVLEQIMLRLFTDAIVVGFTATPDYLGTVVKDSYMPVTLDNGRVLYAPPNRLASAHFGTCLDQRTMRWGIEEGFLAPLAWGQVDFDVSLDDVGVAETEDGLDYNSEELRRLLTGHWPFMVDTLVELYKRGEYDLPNRQVFGVCQTVREAQELAEAIRGLGVSAASVTGKTRTVERNTILGGFKAREFKFISSVDVLREGWDAPNAEVCLMLRPTRSRVRYIQIMGRVLRLDPNGEFKCAMVLDAHFLKTRLAPLSAPILFGLPGQVVEDGGMLMGPRSDRLRTPLVSPYKSTAVTPKMVVVPVEYEMEYWAGEDGTFSADGETWSSIRAADEILGISSVTIGRRVDDSVRSRPGRDRAGHRTTFYSLADLKRVCARLLEEHPKADKTRGFVSDGVEWMTACGFADTRCAKGNNQYVEDRLDASVRSREGKNRSGQVTTFYAVPDLERVCADLLPTRRLKMRRRRRRTAATK